MTTAAPSVRSGLNSSHINPSTANDEVELTSLSFESERIDAYSSVSVSVTTDLHCAPVVLRVLMGASDQHLNPRQLPADALLGITSSTRITIPENSTYRAHLLADQSFYKIALESSTTPSQWQAAQAYTVGQTVRSLNHSSTQYFQCVIAGTSGATEPNWPAAGAEVIDGGVTWKTIRNKPFGVVESMFYQAPTAAIALTDSGGGTDQDVVDAVNSIKGAGGNEANLFNLSEPITTLTDGGSQVKATRAQLMAGTHDVGFATIQGREYSGTPPSTADGSKHVLRVDAQGNQRTRLVGTSMADGTTPTGEAINHVVIDSTGTLSTKNNVITRHHGDDVPKATGMQGCLIYGRNEGGSNQLQAVDVNAGRLHVNLEEIAASGPLTDRTSLPAMQICGKSSATNMQTLACDGNGTLQVAASLDSTGPFDSQSGAASELPAVQICGASTGSDLTTLKVDSDGVVQVAGTAQIVGSGGTNAAVVDTDGRLAASVVGTVTITNAPDVGHDGLDKLGRAIVGDVPATPGSGYLQVGSKNATNNEFINVFADGDTSTAIDVSTYKSIQILGHYARQNANQGGLQFAPTIIMEQTNDDVSSNPNWNGHRVITPKPIDIDIGTDIYRTFEVYLPNSSKYVRFSNKSGVIMNSLRLDYRMFT